ncbi:MAG: helical backbone metal receptor [Acidimicrobiales bacterium]
MTERSGLRVVSLVPSVTETLLAWGITPAACTRFCEQPGLTHVGGTKDPDIAAIVALRPDLVVLCEEENRLADHDRLQVLGVRCEVLRIDSVDDVAVELARLARAVGATPPPGRLGEPAADLAPPARRVRAFVPIWRRPWMTMSARCYGSSLLASLGVDNVYADAPDRYPQCTLEQVAARAPDVVLLPTEPYPFAERHVAELAAALAPARLVDGADLFWWGVRTPEAQRRLGAELAELAELGAAGR